MKVETTTETAQVVTPSECEASRTHNTSKVSAEKPESRKTASESQSVEDDFEEATSRLSYSGLLVPSRNRGFRQALSC